MTNIPLSHWLALATALFAIGTIGVITRRNMLIALMSLEIMLNGVGLAFLAFARFRGDVSVHAAVFIVMAVAAAEVAIGLALAIAMYRNNGSIDLDQASRLKG
ncbi:MAG: NADH-quinone oxidoreductase subunit K [Deltaproteobacteria bacterium ADurb.Bin058]|jgi:NADH-quinone oxidoreductase subunit K|nr:MAG: NADH-quinone oxidoreductase subunit K [Deltaproteobacteria bacterium ADurb.Bin058]HHW97277.1 NADH-quinone oxidoreductase subunit NuoK [Oligoflexales bacterium]